MSIFSGLEKLGLGKLEHIDVYDKEEEKKKAEAAEEENEGKPETEYLFDKSHVCPVCDNHFTSLTVKTGRVKTISHDSDLRPVYEGVDALKYDAIVCPKCGYGALARFYTATSSTQNKWVREQISINFKGLEELGETYTYDDALMFHKLALVSTIVKRGKISERAYCCLKIAWLYRGKAEQLEKPEEKEACRKEEMDMIKKAYEGFIDAFPKERFPMCGMDELTVTYLVADLARQIGDYDTALRWVSRIIVSTAANDRVKERARKLRDLIKEESEKEESQKK